MSFDLDTYISELENYEFGVKHIIPTEYKSVDDSFTDELDNILDARSYLETQGQLYPQQTGQKDFAKRLVKNDNLLRAKREILLKLIPNFGHARTRLKQTPPKNHWWYYLDKPLLSEVEQQIIAVQPNRLGLTFDQAIISQFGLRVGQPVKVIATDAKHILISIQE
jgi:hypothetical protein